MEVGSYDDDLMGPGVLYVYVREEGGYRSR